MASFCHLSFVKLFEEPRHGALAAQMGALGASGSAMAIGSFFAVRCPKREGE